MDAYDEVRSLAPNYVQMHHQVGNLHMKRSDHARAQGKTEEAEHFLDRALTRFTMYHSIDPVYPPNYMRIGQIHMMRKHYAKAVKVYEENVLGTKCRVASSLRAKPGLLKTLLSYQTYIGVSDDPHPVHRHPQADTFFNLANAYYMTDRWVESDFAYKRALARDPKNPSIRRNLSVLYQKAQAAGRLRAVKPADAEKKTPGLPFTGYEIAPRGK